MNTTMKILKKKVASLTDLKLQKEFGKSFQKAEVMSHPDVGKVLRIFPKSKIVNIWEEGQEKSLPTE